MEMADSGPANISNCAGRVLVKYHFLLSISWCYLRAHGYIEVAYQ